MPDNLTLSYINLFAILRNLEDLCEMDNESKNLISNKNISINFIVKNGPSAFLIFENGKCYLKKESDKSTIKLYFKSPEHFNDMFLGKANPIPLKGLTKLNFLKNEFMKLTEKLSYYLKPTDELLKNKSYFKINTFLTSYTAFFTLAEIGNNDPIGKLNASRIPNGVVQIAVLNNGPSVYLTSKDGYLSVSKNPSIEPRAYMTFDSLETANGILNGRLDSYTCISTGKLRIKGYLPMIDNINKLLCQVPAYLK